MRITDMNADVHITLGKAYAKEGRMDRAIIEYEHAIEKDRNDAMAHAHLGAAYCSKAWIDFNKDWINKAVTEFKRAGVAYYKRKQIDKAIEVYMWAIELDPNDAETHYSLGQAFFDKRWLDKAIAEFRYAIELNPNHAKAYLNLGVAYAKKEWIDKAITEYKQAIKLKPNEPLAYYNLGLAYYKMKQIDKAIAQYKVAIELNPNDAVSHYNLALAYYCIDHFDMAWKHVRRAKDLGMASPNPDQLIALLRNVSQYPFQACI